MATTPVIGHLIEFDYKSASWEIFSARLCNYFIANNVTDANIKRAIFLNTLNEDSYKLMYDLSSPIKPEGKSYEELIHLFNNQFKPIKSQFAARYQFYNARKQETEAVVEWMARVRSLAAKCDFAAEQFNWVLRDIFVIGMEPGGLRDRLFEEDATKLDVAKMVKLAQNKECTRQQLEAIEEARSTSTSASVVVKSEPVHKIGFRQRPGQRRVQQATGQDQGDGVYKCFVCGRAGHTANICRYKNCKCYICGKIGHIAPVCERKSDQTKVHRNSKHNYLENVSDVNSSNSSTSSSDELAFFPLLDTNAVTDSFTIDLMVENEIINFEIDTGTAVTAISKDMWKEKFYKVKINKTTQILNDYVGKKIIPLGIIDLKVKYKNKKYTMNAFVIENGGPPLLGRTWMDKLNLGISTLIKSKNCNHLSAQNCLNDLCAKYESIFNKRPGTFNKHKINLPLRENAVSKYFNPRPLPFKLKDKVNDELERLVSEGILIPTDYSEWGTPIVPVWKSDGSIRLCGDFKITLNPALQVYKHPLPRINDLFVQLQGGEEFSKIDLSHAFNQLELDSVSQQLCTISTHKGLFRYTRLPYGIVSAPALFQKTIEAVLAGIEGVVCFVDDILVTGKNREQHFKNLEEVFKRLYECGLTIKRDKCKFLQKTVKFLGHVIDKVGLRASKEKVEKILNMNEPADYKQLKSLLGTINYFGKFLPNLAATLCPLYNLTKKNTTFVWSEKCKIAFLKVKQLLSNSPILVHYNPELPLKLTVDASSKGLGAILCHVFPDKSEKPIAYSSRVLKSSEINYSQIDKEALAIVWAVRYFHQYIFGNEFILITDHKPLLSIFGSNKGIPQLAASRLQRWAYILSAYNYKIEYIDSNRNVADFLSRFNVEKINCISTDLVKNGELCYIKYISEEVPLNFKKIKAETSRDITLSKVLGYINRGWPEIKVNNYDKNIQQYAIRKNELSIEQGCILWGYRLVIPNKFRDKILTELHVSHLGIVKMKSLARSYVWWPDINKDIENISQKCKICVKHKNSAPKVTLHPWEWPKEPWSRLHIDFLGPFLGKNFFVLVDAHSKWIECFAVHNVTSTKTIEILRDLFARYGLPRQIVSDNASVFTSQEFQNFLKINEIQHLTGSPYHPISNGAAENAVKQIKNCILNSVGRDRSANLNAIIARFLFDYRNTTHSTTNETPAKLLINKNLRCRFDLLFPSITDTIENHQNIQIKNYGGRGSREFEMGAKVLVRDYRIVSKPTWCLGVIKSKIGSCIYTIEADDGSLWKRHADQIKHTFETRNKNSPASEISDVGENVSNDCQLSNDDVTVNLTNDVNNDDTSENYTSHNPIECRSGAIERPKRIVKPPDRFQPGKR